MSKSSELPSQVAPYGLKTNGRISPQEVNFSEPIRLTWRLRGGHESEALSFSVRLKRLNSPQNELAWDSGLVTGDETSLVVPGSVLQPVEGYEWTLIVHGAQGAESSATSTFATAPIALSAEWISRNPAPWFSQEGKLVDQRAPLDLGRSWRTMYSQPALQLRKTFEAPNDVVKARAFLTAKGVYRSYLNGQRIGSDELTPGWTSYEKRLDYQGYDVTHLVKTGSNVWAAEVADGWWSGYIGYHTRKQAEQYGSSNAFFGELHLELRDGSKLVIKTDADWQEKYGSIVMSDLLMGEYQDYTVETLGWMVDATVEGWRPVITESNSLRLLPQIAEPMKVVTSLPAISITKVESGALVDFGQNVVGRVRLGLHDTVRGDVIRVRHGEMLNRGQLYTENLRSAEALDILVAPGGDMIFEPAFTLHGFRYVLIEGLRQTLSEADISAQIISSALESVGSVETSSPLVNRLIQNIEWSQRGNFVGIPTDCNQRDERLGWTADAQIFAPTASFNTDVSAFFASWLDDLQSSQRADGLVPDVAPIPPTSNNFNQGAPAWADGAVIIPWHMYRLYGDRNQLERLFPMMQGWVDYVSKMNPDHDWTNVLGNNYGDWLSVNADTPKLVVSLAYRINSVDIVAKAAKELGLAVLAAQYEALARQLRASFAAKFVSPEGRVHGETQTSYLLTLAWDLAPQHQSETLVRNLVASIRDNGNLLSTGFLGVNLLGPTLTRFGHSEIAVDLLLEERFPSWGYSISQGATTIWERWDGWTEANGFHTPNMNSFNHYSLGSVGEWIYRQLAGIDQAQSSVAYREIVFEPILSERLDYVRAEFESPRGLVRSGWSRSGSDFLIEVSVPPGSTGEVRIRGEISHVGPGNHSFKA